MPCVLIFYCCAVKNRKVYPVMFIGIMTAVIYCLVRVMGFYSHRLIPDSLSSNYIYYLIRYTLIPVISIYVLYILLTRDSWEFKLNMFFPLLGTFYAIFIPYKVIAFTQSIYSGYDIFLRPVLYTAMIGQCAICLSNLYKSITNKKIINIILNILVMIVYLLIPAMMDAMFDLNMELWIIVTVTVLYGLITLTWAVLKLVLAKIKK